jgi:NAD-dependent deacetylase
MDESLRKELREVCQKANYILFLGGAGISTASGIPDFRSPSGLYQLKSKYGVPYETMLSHTYFEEHPDIFYDFYWSAMVHPNAKPNKAHLALANWEKKGHLICIVTQNIDGLHEDAGNSIVLEVHGSVRRYTCPVCGEKKTLDDIVPSGVPLCPRCHNILKPDVVLYEEPLDEETLNHAVAATKHADVMIIAGTSMNVYPIAALPLYFTGKKIIMINKEPTPFDGKCDYVIHDDAGKVLEEILGDEE